MTTIAFAGLGRMGSAMAARLRDAGHDLRVWNRSLDKARAWVGSGGVLCESPEQAGLGASQAHLMLADDVAVETTLFGARGLLTGLNPNALIIDHSTVSVAGSRERAGRLARDGWRFLQAPVFVSPPQIAQGEGLMLIGGDPQAYERAQVTLHQILAKHFVIGEKPEEAAAFKLMGNAMLMSVVEALAEFFAIAKASGISAPSAYRLFESFNPCGTISRRGPRMSAGDYAPQFTLSMALKDVRLMLQAAGDDATVPALKVIEAKMQRLIAAGFAGNDLSALSVETIPPARAGSAR